MVAMAHLIVRSESPFNAETPSAAITADFITPQHRFYIRSHGEVPVLSEHSHRVAIRGKVRQSLGLTVGNLRDSFELKTVMAVMQCAGNRRADLHSVRPVLGDPWAAGAIGNAEWTGVSLADVLRAAGAVTDAALHVAFESSDITPDGTHYGVSIPMTKALCPDVLLAFAMNGEPLAPEHGFPVRMVVPGFAGVRSPKWLSAIAVQDRPSDNAFQRRDYKLLPPSMTPETVDWSQGITINEMPLNAAICAPETGSTVRAGPLTLRGYATATGRSVVRVDLSRDAGRTWSQATLEQQPDAPWSWTFWTASLDLPAGEHELVVRAWDSAGQTQPAAAADAWNFKGYLSAAWHRVRVKAS